MKIPNLIGKSHGVISKAIVGILKTVKENDKKAIDNGELLKYIIQIYGKNNILNEVKEIYSDHYLFYDEIKNQYNIEKNRYEIKGPFPLVEDGISDAKINRWNREREKSINDEVIIFNHLKDAKNKNYKYGYIIYENIMDIDRLVEIKFSIKSLTANSIKKILLSSNEFKRKVIRVNLLNNERKIYK